jgi:ATPase subunit of ABC transporter with duplicated ATPase domains
VSRRVVAELDCLVSLSKASAMMDEPKCRPTFVDSESAFIDFTELRHPSMSLRTDNFIPNDVRLGGDDGGRAVPRQVLLTGPNMAGKSTLLRMTAAGVIMAQMGCYVPASQATLAPVDKIQTRMGAYDSEWDDTRGVWRIVADDSQTCSHPPARSRSSSTSARRSSARQVVAHWSFSTVSADDTELARL